VLIQGETDTGGKAGVLMMSHPNNRSHPEKLRTWEGNKEGTVFINFNTVQDESWVFEPGKSYKRYFRLFLFDGTLSPAEAEAVWKAFSTSAD
jgi:hypothetical protein